LRNELSEQQAPTQSSREADRGSTSAQRDSCTRRDVLSAAMYVIVKKLDSSGSFNDKYFKNIRDILVFFKYFNQVKSIRY
jgi:hypothetical protein